jgi:predicted DNA-binding protein (MmcQ/YjbR family)
MAVSPAQVREMVFGLADAQEGTHHGHPDFRVRGKIFATLSETESHAAVRLTNVEARALALRSPEVFRLVSDREPIGWASVLLSQVDATELGDLLEEAWQLRASEVPTRRKR